MQLRYLLPFVALISSHSLFAQEETLITNEPAPLPGTDQGSDEPQVIVEVMPEYPGGEKALFKYLSEEANYPKEAKKKGIKGTVYVQFTLDPYGRTSEVKVVRGIGGGCDEEA